MPQLFDVPGWSVPEPTTSGLKSEKSTKKRKRPTSDTSSRLFSAELNLERLMDKLKESTKSSQDNKADSNRKLASGKGKKDKHKGKQQHKPEASLSREISLPKPLQPTGKLSKGKDKLVHENHPRPEKRQKIRHSEDVPRPKSAASDPEANLTALQKSMKASLDGAKFRHVYRPTYTGKV